MKRILCFGDSNTYGHNPKDASRLSKRWTKITENRLGEDYEIIEEGLCGRTTDFHVEGEIDGLSGTTLLRPIIATHKPYDLLIIMLGTNDLLLKVNAELSDSVNGIKKLIEIATQTYPDGKILIISPIEVDKSVQNSFFCELYGPTRACELSKQFASVYLPVAEQYGCEFMNAADLLKHQILTAYIWMLTITQN